MKLLRYSKFAMVLVGLLASSASGQVYSINGVDVGESYNGWGSGENDSRTILSIKPDGSCTLTNESVQQRKTLEMQVTAWERYSKAAEGGDSEDENTPPISLQPTKAEQKKLTDEELVSKIREMYQQRSELGGQEGIEIDQVEATTNSVRMVTRRAYASLKELLGQNVYSWGPSMLMFEEVRCEIDTNRNLRITFTPTQAAARYTKDLIRGWKAAKTKFEWRLVLPGKILTSGLPATEGNATWVDLDGEKPESLELGLKLVGAPLAITAEAGEIKLDEPLESKKLVRAAWRQSRSEPDLPITEAGPGFLAEPVSLTISTTHYFPEGKEHFKNRPDATMFGLESSGTAVWAKLFPPKGRQIRSVSDLRVKAAKDDKGRAIPTGAEGSEEAESYSEFGINSDEADKGGAARVQVHLGLPAPDAKAIDELNCEAVALTIGGWKEMVLTNVLADAKKEIDLGEVLAGAKMIVKKISGKKPQTLVEVQLDGSAAVNQLEVKIKTGSRRGGSSSVSNQRSTVTGSQTKRNLTIHSYEFEAGGGGKSGPPTLSVRYPQDIKRERVQFKLTALDLL